MIRKQARLFMTALAMVFVTASLSGCVEVKIQSGEADKEEIREETGGEDKKTKSPEKEEAEEKADSAEDTGREEITEDIYREDASEVFKAMSELRFTFSSGAGGWGTELTVNPDGTFSGTYHDSDMGITGPGFPEGTLYECVFSGRFSDTVRSAGPLMHTLKIESIEYENTPGTEEVKENMHVIYTGPYGLEGLENHGDSDAPLVFLEGGAVTSALNPEELSWVSVTHFGTGIGPNYDYVEDVPEELPYAVLLNNVDQYAFFTDNISEKNKTFLVNKAAIPGLKNLRGELREDGTYFFVDKNDDGSFQVINACFKAGKSYDAYNRPEELVLDSLREIYGKHAPTSDQVYVTSPKDAYEMSYPDMMVNGRYSDYAFWVPEGSGDGISCDGRFLCLHNDGTENGYVYAYIIESRKGSGSYPDPGFANAYISSLSLTGRNDHISSAGEGKGAVRKILTGMQTPEGDKVRAMELVMVGADDKALIEKYHLENEPFDNDYEIIPLDKDYHEYTLSSGGATTFYVQYPKDGFHRYIQACELEEYMGEASDENRRLMELYLNEDDEVVYASEIYVP